MAEKVRSVFQGDVSKNRLEFLFDGIFAIAMTILVLELKLPDSLPDKRSASELGKALLHHWRTFFSYLVSFFILSGFWFIHNQVYARLKRISVAAMVTNIWMLVWAAFVPFCAHLLGKYPGNPLAMLIYVWPPIAFLSGMLALVVTAGRQGLFAANVPAADIRKLRRRLIRSLALLLLFFSYYAFVFPAIR